jgi:hypothetical protein
VARVAWIEELRLLTNQLAADHVEIIQIAALAHETNSSVDRVIDCLNERVTRVKWSAAQLAQRLSAAGMEISSSTEVSECTLFIEQLSLALIQIDIASVEDDPVTAAVEHVIDTLWHVTLCHARQLDTTALITCSSAFSEQCWTSFIDTHHLSMLMNDTRDAAEILNAWFEVPQSHVYYSCWRAQLRSLFDMLTAVTSASPNIPPNIDISIGTAISGSRDQCAYYASTRHLVRHEFDFDTLELRVTQVTANISVPLYNVLSYDGATFIALIR